MPEEGMVFQPHEEIMSYEEIAETVAALAPMGLRKIRLTGGEPTVRKDLENLISLLSGIGGIEDISLTTNGMFLAGKANLFKKAGLNRVNISLDSLREDRFRMVTRGGDVHRVLSGIQAAFDAGFDPIKLNVVLVKGINDDEIADFIALTIDRPLHVRFIEYMPIGSASDDWRSSYVPLTAVTEACSQAGWITEAAQLPKGNGPAESMRIAGAKGTFGLIHPVSDHFCDQCNRLRLTADGHIKACLYWSDELHVKPLAAAKDADGIRQLFLQALRGKPKNHEMALALENKTQSHTPTLRRMSQIGG